MSENKYVEKKSWGEFRNTGLLLIINQLLHVFGWALVLELDDDQKVVSVYPARVKFRGFAGPPVSEAYKKISQYLKDNAETLDAEVEWQEPEK